MKNPFFQFALYSMMAFVCAGCNKDSGTGIDFNDDNDYDTELHEVKMSLSISVEQMTNRNWSGKDIVGLFFIGTEEERVTDSLNYNIKAYYDNGSWYLDRKVVADEEPMTAYAYYPYNLSTELGSWFLRGNEEENYMYGSCSYSVNAVNKHIHVNMKRALGYVNIRIKKKDYPLEVILKKVAIVGEENQLPIAGVMDMVSERIKVTEYGDYVKDSLNIVVNESFSTKDDVLIPVIPMVADIKTRGDYASIQGARLSVVLNNTEYDIPLERETVYWEQGKVADINITFDGKEIQVDDVRIKEWEDERMPDIIVSM